MRAYRLKIGLSTRSAGRTICLVCHSSPREATPDPIRDLPDQAAIRLTKRAACRASWSGSTGGPPMDEEAVREQSQQMGDALVAGDVDRAFSNASDELRRHLGEVVGLLPLPVREATVESVDRGGS